MTSIKPSGEDAAWERHFDPPYLGIPAGASVSARTMDQEGRFMEIFLAVANGRVTDAGFLTDIPRAGILCASIWCELVRGKRLQEALDIGSDHVFDRVPLSALETLDATLLCVRAGRKALAKALGESPRHP